MTLVNLSNCEESVLRMCCVYVVSVLCCVAFVLRLRSACTACVLHLHCTDLNTVLVIIY